MVNLCDLLEKYSEFSKNDDDIFVYVDRMLLNFFEARKRQHQVENELEHIKRQLAEKQKLLSISHNRDTDTPIRKRKALSLDSPHLAHKENVSIIENSTIFSHKSHTDTSLKECSLLEHNIIDSEEPMFALSQSPPPTRKVLSPRNEPTSESTPVDPVKKVQQAEGNILRPSLLNANFTTPGIVAKETALSASRKWTAKKPKEDILKADKQTPVTVTRYSSLMDCQARFRQTKLNFSDHQKLAPKKDSDATLHETVFNDFVISTPPSATNRSSFLKSLRMKKKSNKTTEIQSDTLAADHKSFGALATVGSKIGAKTNADLDSHTYNDNIDQTYCPGVESINKLAQISVKQEPRSQQKSLAIVQPDSKSDCFPSRPKESDTDGETSEVEILPTSSQRSIISVADSQRESDKIMAELNDQEQSTRVAKLCGFHLMTSLNPSMERVQPDRKLSASNTKAQKFSPQHKQPILCDECRTLYRFYTSSGVSNDTALTKLPRNCRNCSMAQLHDTPSGFWDPDFLPTQPSNRRIY